MDQEQASSAMGTQIEFVGFSDDCRVVGRVELEGARLADMLNSRPTIVVHDAVLVSTCDGHSKSFEELEIGRDELDIVVASGPRGDPRRRLATKPNGVRVKLGPYSAEGFMHSPPTADLVQGLSHRPAMVAITDAVLEYNCSEGPVSQWYRTILVNRELAISLRAVTNPGGLQEVAPSSVEFEGRVLQPEA